MLTTLADGYRRHRFAWLFGSLILTITASPAPLRGEGRRQPPVVQVRGDPEARVERSRGTLAPFGEEEGICVDDRRQLVRGLRSCLAVEGWF
jgi:hypothetical protein